LEVTVCKYADTVTRMSNKRSLLVLCARIGYNPPRR
jgi:hypothetical protein